MSLNRSLLSQMTRDVKKKPSKPRVPRNQWQHPGEITTIPSNTITMQGVGFPVLGVGDNGVTQMMYPDQDYHFPGAGNVTEYPMMQRGGWMDKLPIKQEGGELMPPANYEPLTIEQRKDWNQFLDMLEQEGVAGSTDLDIRDQKKGSQYIKKYQKLYPDTFVSEDIIPYVQYEQQLIRRGNEFPTMDPVSFQKVRKRIEATNPAYIKRPVSPVDGWLGSVTSKSYYPQFKVEGSINKNYETDFEGYAKEMLSKNKMGGQAGWMDHLPRLQYAGATQGPVYDNIVNPQAQARMAELELNRRVAEQQGKQDIIGMPLPKESSYSRIMNIASNPLTALSYKMRYGQIPENFQAGPRNVYDIATDVVNPTSVVKSIGDVPQNINDGNYAQAALTLASILPQAKTAVSLSRKLGRSVDKAVPILRPYVKTVNALGSDLRKELVGHVRTSPASRQKAIAEGNAWLDNWTNHPTTQKKGLDASLDEYADREYYNDFFDETKGVTKEMLRKQAYSNKLVSSVPSYLKNAKSNVREFPLKKQFKQLKEAVLMDSKPSFGFDAIHNDNLGVSYTHNGFITDPADYFKDYPKYGEWVSRRIASNKNRASTVVHEGTHGVYKNQLLQLTGNIGYVQPRVLTDKIKTIEDYKNHLQSKGINVDSKNLQQKYAYLRYMAKPTEVHARIMQARHHFGLTPDDIITPEWYTKMANEIAAGKTPIEKHFPRIINNPQAGADLFNKLLTTTPLVVGAVGAAASSNQKARGGQTKWLDQL